ncbi:MAG: OsmC family protein [bacterium]
MTKETAIAVPRSPVSVGLTIRGHKVVQDKVPASGGKDEGPMASEFLLAALLACQHSTSVKVAAKRRVAWTIGRLDGAMDFDSAGDIATIDVVFTVTTDAADAAVDIILRLTEKTCTISRALKVPVAVSFRRA